MSVIKEMSNQVGKCNEVNKVNKTINESLTAELERYKEQIIIFEEIHKFDLNDREKYIDSQLRDVIVDRNANVVDFQNEIHSSKLHLSATVESHKPFSTTADVLKKKSKAKEDKYLKEIIELEKKFREYRKYFEIEKKELIIENNHLLEHIICQDVMSIVMHDDVKSTNVLPANNNSLEYDNLEAELLTKENDRLLELIISQDLVHTDVNTLATIANYRNMENSYLDEWMYKLDLEPLSPKLLKNKEAHVDYLKHTQINVDTLRKIVQQATALRPLDSYLDFACQSSKSNKKKHWKPTGKVFTSVGNRWLPTGQTFTIDGTKCPMTRITSTPIVHHKETSQTPIITSNLEIKVPLDLGMIMLQKSWDMGLSDRKCHDFSSLLCGRIRTQLIFTGIILQTRLIMETIHVEFDELTTMASKQFGSRLELQILTPRTISLGFVENPSSLIPYVLPTKNEWDILFQPMFDEYFNPPKSIVSSVPAATAPRPADSTGTPSSTTIDQDVPSASTSPTSTETQTPVIFEGVEEQLQPTQFDKDPFYDILTSEPNSQDSSSNVQPANPPFEHLSK
uniref:Integrase, catalytic region, zinc finger, CCHC-type, peptidase aspartic, catalytic n=1 Tax=Tanacetum cinerariifolium TaxID=118510 RepID=A0A6L2LQT1_TANCI|nr:hypothetical protein [Tanacetum cinerariifolium]